MNPWYATMLDALKAEGIHHLWPVFMTIRKGESAVAVEQGVFMEVERNINGKYRVVQNRKV